MLLGFATAESTTIHSVLTPVVRQNPAPLGWTAPRRDECPNLREGKRSESRTLGGGWSSFARPASEFRADIDWRALRPCMQNFCLLPFVRLGRILSTQTRFGPRI